MSGNKSLAEPTSAKDLSIMKWLRKNKCIKANQKEASTSRELPEFLEFSLWRIRKSKKFRLSLSASIKLKNCLRPSQSKLKSLSSQKKSQNKNSRGQTSYHQKKSLSKGRIRQWPKNYLFWRMKTWKKMKSSSWSRPRSTNWSFEIVNSSRNSPCSGSKWEWKWRYGTPNCWNIPRWLKNKMNSFQKWRTQFFRETSSFSKHNTISAFELPKLNTNTSS